MISSLLFRFRIHLAVVLTAVLCLWGNFAFALGEYTIVCGQTTNGSPINCNMSTHRCYRCKTKKGWFVKKRIIYNYNCINRSAEVPKGCEATTAGGLTGDQDVKIFWIKRDKAHVEGKNCVTKNLMSMYSSTCYSCEIVETLASAFIRASAKAYDVSRQAGNAILIVGMIIWIGLFVMKNISSFTTVEPMKMIQDLLVQLFKIFIAFVIVNSGIPTILHYTMEPIMLAGTEFGDAILNANIGVNRSATEESQEALRKEQEATQKATQDLNRQLGLFDYGQEGDGQ